MIPLRLTAGGSFFVGRNGSERTMWLCREPKCIHRILKNPGQIRRPRGTPPPTREIIDQGLSEFLRDSARRTLLSARKSGLIVDGSHRVKKCLQQNISAIVFAMDAGDTTRTQIEQIHNPVESLIFPATSREIGLLLSRGRRSVLALRPSRKTQSLIDTLRGWHSLG